MVVNNRERSVLYLDPLKRYSYMDGLLSALLQFLKAELVHHLHKRIEHTAWRDVFYRENPEQHRFPQCESTLYVLKHAACLSQGSDHPITSADLQDMHPALFRAIGQLGLS